MTDQHGSAEPLANVSADLTALADTRARVRIDAAERLPDTVGSVLGRYRGRAGLTEQELADRLRIDLPVLADLAEEVRPERRRLLAGHAEISLDQPAELFVVNPARLLAAFEQGDP